MSEPTLAELMGPGVPSVASPLAPKDASLAPVATTSHDLPAPRGSNPRVRLAPEEREGAFGAAVFGAADTLSFDFIDEIAAGVNSGLPTWLGGNGRTYEDSLRRGRAKMEAAAEDHPYAYYGAGIAAGFIPIVGWAGRAKGALTAVSAGRAVNLGRVVGEGAAAGAAYGYGSSNSESLFSVDRVRDAAVGGLFGAGGSFILGTTIIPAGRWGLSKAATLMERGRPLRYNFKFKVGAAERLTDDLAEDLATSRLAHAKRTPASKETPAAPGRTAATEPKRVNPLNGLDDDVIETGALFSAKEIQTGGAKARTTILNRIAEMSPQAAKVATQKLNKAMQDGDLASDPHFRSILGIDLTKATDEVDGALKAAELFEDMTSALLERANMGKRTVKGMEDELKRRFGGEATEAELDRLVELQKEANGSANIGSTMMGLSAVQFARATKELLPLVVKGEPGARDLLASAFTKAIRISAKGQFLVSSAGRNLGMLSHKRGLVFTEIVDGKAQVESSTVIEARVKEALSKLDDNELTETISRIRDLTDLEQVQDILLNTHAAEQVSSWIKARNSVGLWIKSNSLTPTSGIINTVGFVLHDLFRNGWARDYAAHVAKMAGRVDEATIIKFQREVSKAVTFQAHGAGLRSAAQRLKWEWMESVQRITSVSGASKAALRASASKQAMLARGYAPPAIREFDQMKTLAVTDLRGFEDKLAKRASEGGAFGSLVNALERTYATTVNTMDALGTATARVVSGALDDWGRNFVKVKEVYASSAALATREAIEAGLNEQQMVEYISKRSAELAEKPTVDILEEVERKLVAGEDFTDVDKALLRRDYDAEKEAERVLFMDGPQTQGGRVAAAAASKLDTLAGGWAIPGILMTYIRTPTRIFERGLVSYTPWAAKAEETAAILARGGVEAAVERARMELGSMIIGMGMLASAAGIITVTNGGYKNSSNLTGAPANRLNLPGGAYVELSRLDPFALSLAMGGIVGQAVNAYSEDRPTYGRDEAAAQALQVAFYAVRESIFEKSYLTSARDLLKSIFADDDAGLVGGLGKMLSSAITRAVPLSGTMRQVQETARGEAIEAVSFMDQLFKVTPGMAAYLPARVDALGNSVDGRVMGLAAGTTSDTDEVTRELADLKININGLAKADPTGFDLTSEELSELRRIRGNEAANNDGMTMKEALAHLLDDPEFQALPSRDAQQKAVTDLLSGFNEPARELFEERNQQYLADREAFRSLKDYIADGLDRRAASDEAQLDVEAQGLTPSRLPF